MEVTIIDDDYLSIFLTKRLLEKYSFITKVTEFTDADAALTNFKASNFKNDISQLIILDLNMPNMNGFEFMTQFQDIKLNMKTLNICVVSSSINKEDKTLSLEFNNVIDFISKPLTQSVFDTFLKVNELDEGTL